MISADSHVIEPPDVWATRLEGEWGERAPQVRRDDDGNDWWYVDGHRTNSFAGGTQTGRRFADADALVLADRFENVRAGAYDPDRYVDENLGDGVTASVLYPTQQMQHYAVRNTALVDATCRAYNDWCAEFAAAHPQRLRGVAALNVDNIETAAFELERAVGQGLAAGLVPVGLPAGRSYADPAFDRLWAVAVAVDVPLSLHIGTYRANPLRQAAPVIPGAQSASAKPAQTAFATADYWVRQALGDIIFSGVFERHPGLRIVSAEHEVGWLPFFVERMDYTYTQRATKGHRFAGAVLPSDFVRENVWVQFCEDPSAPWVAESIGSERLLWGSDYPHSEGLFPRSSEVFADLTATLDDAARKRIATDNAARLYKIDPR
ncbi:MAG TPA: amidohydrolase family protein [Acidimicrobiales bacterium]|nr:amidohydrolase family protein [Acidimicrobiales bacterium]